MQNTLLAESDSAFAMILDEASGQNEMNLPLDMLAQPAAIAEDGTDQNGTQPSAELSLVAAMFAIPPQPLIQNIEQSPQIQKAAAIQSGVQQVGHFSGQSQKADGAFIRAKPGMVAAAMEGADTEAVAFKTANVEAAAVKTANVEAAAVITTNVEAAAVKTANMEAVAGEVAEMPSNIIMDVQNKPAGGKQAATYQKPVQPLAGRTEVQAVKQKPEDVPAVDADIPQNRIDKGNGVFGESEAAEQTGERIERVRHTAVQASPIHASATRKSEKVREVDVKVPIAASVVIQRAEHIQQAQDVQAAQGADPVFSAGEEPPALQVARATMAAIKRGVTEYKLRLKPEGLGQVDVTVSAKGSEITLSMKTDNEAARGLILGHADELRTELRAQNYQVNGLTVEVSMDNQGGSESFASGQHAQQAFERGRMTAEQPYTQPAEVQAPPSRRPQPAPRSSTISYRV